MAEHHYAALRFNRRRFLQSSLSLIASAAVIRSARAAAALNVQLEWIKNVQSAGQFAALKHGFFKEENLDVSLNAGGPQLDPVALLASGATDIAFVVSPMSVLAARSRGVPIVVLGAGETKSMLGLCARADRHLTLPNDLKDKKIGYQPIQLSLLKAALYANKLSPSDVSSVVVTGDPTLLIAGRIEAMTCSVLNVPADMKVRGVEPASWTFSDLGLPLQGSMVTCLEGTLAKRKDDIVRFLRAIGRGWAYNCEHPEEVASEIVSEWGEGLNLQQQTIYNQEQIPFVRNEITKQHGLFWIEKSTWEANNGAAAAADVIEKPVDLDKLLQYAPLEAAEMPKV